MKKSRRAYTSILGRMIVAVTTMRNEVMQDLGWTERTAVVYFGDGSFFFASEDGELNGPGVLLGENPERETDRAFYIRGGLDQSRIYQGLTVKNVRPMDPVEMRKEGWEEYGRINSSQVLVFQDGTKIFASKDFEGNGPGRIYLIQANRLFTVVTDGSLRPA